MLCFSFSLSDNQAQINDMAASNVMPADSAHESFGGNGYIQHNNF